MKFLFKKPVEELSLSEFKKLMSDKPIQEKNKILNYLNKYKPSAFTSEPVFDKITGEQVYEVDNGHTDGTYQWYESDIYHLRKYNLKLNDDFIEYVLSK